MIACNTCLPRPRQGPQVGSMRAKQAHETPTNIKKGRTIGRSGDGTSRQAQLVPKTGPRAAR